MNPDPLGLAAYGSYGRRYADGGGVQGGNENGANAGMADGVASAVEVGPGSYDSAGSPSFGLDPSAAATSSGFFDKALSMGAKSALGMLGVTGAPGALAGVGLSAAMHGGTPTASSLGGLFGSAVGAMGGPVGSMIGGTIGSLAGDYLGRHGDVGSQAAAAAAGPGRGAGDASGWIQDYTQSTPPAAAQPMAQGLAGGGVAGGGMSRLAHGSGLVPGASMGRADQVPASVPQGAYVVPADVVSGIGQGNTAAGGKRLSGMLASEFKPQGFAGGGRVQMMPVRLSGGEYVVHPAHCAHLGGGDVKAGHAELDKMVATVRQASAQHAMHAPAPR